MKDNNPGGQADQAGVRGQAEGAEQPGSLSPRHDSDPRATQDPAVGVLGNGAQ